MPAAQEHGAEAAPETAPRIETIDPNFLRGTQIDVPGLVWRDGTAAPFAVHGLVRSERHGRFHRLPDTLIAGINPGVTTLATHTAGGRVRFATDARTIAVRVKPLYADWMPHMPLTSSMGCDVYIDNAYAATLRPAGADAAPYEGLVRKAPGMREVMLHLPLYNGVEGIAVAVEAGARVCPPAPYGVREPVLFYGSSITQGGCASRPGNAYPAFLSRWLDTDVINLGFSGFGKGETAMAAYIAGLSLSVFVMDYDHNAPDAAHLERTHEPFFRIVRAARPNLPIVLVSLPDVRFMPDWAARRSVIRQTYARARAEGDGNVWFVDGATLFGDTERDACTVDGSHPNDLGFYRMAKALLPVLREALGAGREEGEGNGRGEGNA